MVLDSANKNDAVYDWKRGEAEAGKGLSPKGSVFWLPYSVTVEEVHPELLTRASLDFSLGQGRGGERLQSPAAKKIGGYKKRVPPPW